MCGAFLSVWLLTLQPTLAVLFGNMLYLCIILDERNCGSVHLCLCLDNIYEKHPHPVMFYRSHSHCLQTSEQSIVITFFIWSGGFYPGLRIEIQHITYYNIRRFPTCLLARQSSLRRLKQTNPLRVFDQAT